MKIITTDSERTGVFRAITTSIDFAAFFPHRVFRRSWRYFLFFESDKMFVASFVDVLIGLMDIEGSTVSGLLNCGKARGGLVDESACIFIDRATSGDEYVLRLRAGGPSSGWLFGMDRYGCTSDVARWCIYCEKGNDVAVLGFENATDVTKFSSPVKKLGAEPLQVLLRGGAAELFPFSRLIPEWESNLLINYGVSSEEGESLGSVNIS